MNRADVAVLALIGTHPRRRRGVMAAGALGVAALVPIDERAQVVVRSIRQT